MLTIQPAVQEDLHDFSIREWHTVDIEHYGKPVEWNLKEFLFKAVDEDGVVGMISGKHESGVLYIEDVLVGQNARRKGIGKKLMKHTEVYGKKLGAHKAYLITGKNWEAAKFYESLGYNKCGDLPDHHFHKDFVAYSKKL